jgi:ligand-binding SRPBCC domain-containing protein
MRNSTLNNNPTANASLDAIRIGRHPTGRGYQLEAVQFLPQPRDRIFEFFSDAFQLEKLTPKWLGFSVLTKPPIEICSEIRIDYRLRIHGIPLRWQSEISVWEPPFRFVDLQTRGPYRRWHHEHTFEAVNGGTLCRDIVDYEVYGGGLINAVFVRPDVEKIFNFRQKKLLELFGQNANFSTQQPSRDVVAPPAR